MEPIPRRGAISFGSILILRWVGSSEDVARPWWFLREFTMAKAPWLCPVTSKKKGYPFEVQLDEGLPPDAQSGLPWQEVLGKARVMLA